MTLLTEDEYTAIRVSLATSTLPDQTKRAWLTIIAAIQTHEQRISDSHRLLMLRKAENKTALRQYLASVLMHICVCVWFLAVSP